MRYDTTTVYRYDPTRPDGKGEFLRTDPGYPEGWDDHKILKQMPNLTNQKGEDTMGRRELDWEVLVPQILELRAEGKGPLEIAKELDIALSTVKRKIKEAADTDTEEQTPTPAPVQAANQAPDKGSAESAPTIIPEPEYAQKPEGCPDPFADMGLKIMADAWVKVLVAKDDPVALALIKELIEQGAV
jgi:hypothetical protein